MQRMTHRTAMAAGLLIATAAGQAMAQGCDWDFTVPGFARNVQGFLTYNNELYVWGIFRNNEGDPNRIARWTGSSWDHLGIGFDPARNIGGPNDAIVWDEGLGSSIYFVGSFQDAGGLGIRGVARWDGMNWHAVGGSPWTGGALSSIAVWDDGNGEALYVGGSFTNSNSPGDRLVKWDGQTWSEVGGGVSPGTINGLCVYQGDLHLVGTYSEAGGVPANRAARWDGTSFHALGDGFGGTGDATGGCLVWDDGINGESLYVWGSGSEAGSVTVNGIGRWDGSAWHALGTGAQRADGSGAWVSTATIFDDGTGEALYIGSHNTNHFTQVGGVPAERIGKWDGVSWSAPNFTGPNHTIFTLFQYDLGDRPALWVGGQFTEIGGIPVDRLSRWLCEPVTQECYANCDGSTTEPILTVDDFTCFINEFAAAQSLPPQQQIEHYANCDGSTTEPILTVDDFTCFINEFAQGCP